MGRTVINETENKQTVILNDSAEGIEGGYFDDEMVWHELEASVSRSEKLGPFANGIGLATADNYSYNNTTQARASMIAPIKNKNYTFTVTDSNKYKLYVVPVTSNTPQDTVTAAAIFKVRYPIETGFTPSYKESDSVTSEYLILTIKKEDGTNFTADELYNSCEAVVTVTEA